VQRRYLTLQTLEGLSDNPQAKPKHIAAGTIDRLPAGTKQAQRECVTAKSA
jgi:hypothetical protein